VLEAATYYLLESLLKKNSRKKTLVAHCCEYPLKWEVFIYEMRKSNSQHYFVVVANFFKASVNTDHSRLHHEQQQQRSRCRGVVKIYAQNIETIQMR
jgi:hypothetical protein